MAATVRIAIIGKDNASGAFRSVNASANKTRASLGKMGVAGGVLAGNLLTTGLRALGGELKSSITGAIDFEESLNKVNVVFGKFSKGIITSSKSAATGLGLTRAEYLEASGSLGNLLVSLKIAPKTVAGMSTSMIRLAADMASFNNVPAADALAAIRSGLTGETEPLKRFGVNMNEATLKAQALKMGLIKATKGALTPQQKALAATSLIMAQTGTAQGDFSRTSGGLANKTKILKARFGDLKDTLGAKLLPILVTLGTWLTGKFIPGVEKFWKQHGPQIIRIFKAIGSFVATAFSGLKDFYVNTFGKFKPSHLKVIGVLVAVIGVALLVAFAPVTLIVAGIVALVLGLGYLYKRFIVVRAIVHAVGGTFGVLGGVVVAVVSFIHRLIVRVVTAVIERFRAFVAGLTAIKNGVVAFKNKTIAVFVSWYNWVMALPGRIIAGLVDGFKRGWHAVTDFISGAVDLIPSAIKSILGLGSPSKVLRGQGRDAAMGLALGLKDRLRAVKRAAGSLAAGVRVNSGKLAIPGPSFAPGESLPLGGGGAPGAVYNISVSVAPMADPAEVGRKVVNAIEAYERKTRKARLVPA